MLSKIILTSTISLSRFTRNIKMINFRQETRIAMRFNFSMSIFILTSVVSFDLQNDEHLHLVLHFGNALWYPIIFVTLDYDKCRIIWRRSNTSNHLDDYSHWRLQTWFGAGKYHKLARVKWLNLCRAEMLCLSASASFHSCKSSRRLLVCWIFDRIIQPFSIFQVLSEFQCYQLTRRLILMNALRAIFSATLFVRV